MRDRQTDCPMHAHTPRLPPSVHRLWFCSQLSPCCVCEQAELGGSPHPSPIPLSPPSSAPLQAPVTPTKSPCRRGLITCGLNKQTHAPPVLRLQEMSTLQVLTLGQTL